MKQSCSQARGALEKVEACRGTDMDGFAKEGVVAGQKWIPRHRSFEHGASGHADVARTVPYVPQRVTEEYSGPWIRHYA